MQHILREFLYTAVNMTHTHMSIKFNVSQGTRLLCLKALHTHQPPTPVVSMILPHYTCVGVCRLSLIDILTLPFRFVAVFRVKHNRFIVVNNTQTLVTWCNSRHNSDPLQPDERYYQFVKRNTGVLVYRTFRGTVQHFGMRAYICLLADGYRWLPRVTFRQNQVPICVPAVSLHAQLSSASLDSFIFN